MAFSRHSSSTSQRESPKPPPTLPTHLSSLDPTTLSRFANGSLLSFVSPLELMQSESPSPQQMMLKILTARAFQLNSIENMQIGGASEHCTFATSRFKEKSQPFAMCHTCAMTRVCSACAVECHKDHFLTLVGKRRRRERKNGAAERRRNTSETSTSTAATMTTTRTASIDDAKHHHNHGICGCGSGASCRAMPIAARGGGGSSGEDALSLQQRRQQTSKRVLVSILQFICIVGWRDRSFLTEKDEERKNYDEEGVYTQYASSSSSPWRVSSSSVVSHGLSSSYNNDHTNTDQDDYFQIEQDEDADPSSSLTTVCDDRGYLVVAQILAMLRGWGGKGREQHANSENDPNLTTTSSSSSSLHLTPSLSTMSNDLRAVLREMLNSPFFRFSKVGSTRARIQPRHPRIHEVIALLMPHLTSISPSPSSSSVVSTLLGRFPLDKVIDPWVLDALALHQSTNGYTWKLGPVEMRPFRSKVHTSFSTHPHTFSSSVSAASSTASSTSTSTASKVLTLYPHPKTINLVSPSIQSPLFATIWEQVLLSIIGRANSSSSSSVMPTTTTTSALSTEYGSGNSQKNSVSKNENIDGADMQTLLTSSTNHKRPRIDTVPETVPMLLQRSASSSHITVTTKAELEAVCARLHREFHHMSHQTPEISSSTTPTTTTTFEGTGDDHVPPSPPILVSLPHSVLALKVFTRATSPEVAISSTNRVISYSAQAVSIATRTESVWIDVDALRKDSFSSAHNYKDREDDEERKPDDVNETKISTYKKKTLASFSTLPPLLSAEDELVLLLPLSPLLLDASIVKLFHDGATDVMWLQAHHGLHIVNAFDTFTSLDELVLNRTDIIHHHQNGGNKESKVSFEKEEGIASKIGTHELKYTASLAQFDSRVSESAKKLLSQLQSMQHFMDALFAPFARNAFSSNTTPECSRDNTFQLIAVADALWHLMRWEGSHQSSTSEVVVSSLAQKILQLLGESGIKQKDVGLPTPPSSYNLERETRCLRRTLARSQLTTLRSPPFDYFYGATSTNSPTLLPPWYSACVLCGEFGHFHTSHDG